ncbi:MAG: hypothetical protein IT158_00360 [Bryobacterales bacterium]|nr:hypothetical protein [Bryobacterales bacterium]
MTPAESIRFAIDLATRFVSPPAVAAEWVLVGLAGLLVALAPARSAGVLRGVRGAFHSLAKRRSLAILICGILPAVLRLCLLGVAPVPDPSIHDEFSHLLLADTLSRGRLSNPTHPHWMFFESIHIIQKPTYNSMYPPAQGLFLALGQVLFQEPWAGVMVSVGLMSAAACWMMQGWLPPAWALFGTLVMILKIGVVGFWMNSYMGGAPGAIGGALVIGSLPRMVRNGRAVHAVLFALGLVILLNSRPFEGAVMGAFACGWLLVRLRRRLLAAPRSLAPLLLPAALVLFCGFAFTAYYNFRVTGDPLRMPYQVNRETYGWPENLAFLPPRPVKLNHRVLQDMHTKEIHNRDVYSSPRLALDNWTMRLYDNWSFFVGPLLTPPLLVLPWMWRGRRTGTLLLILAAMAALNLFQLVLYPYHLAPVAVVLFTVLTQGLRRISAGMASTGRQRGLAAALAVPLCLVPAGALKLFASDLRLPQAYWDRAAEPHREARADIEAWLSARPRGQLVIVRYARHHPVNQEWVYNRADIDGSKVIWAREMDGESNRRLMEYFAGREVWLLEADQYPQRVVRYPNFRAATLISAHESPGRAE